MNAHIKNKHPESYFNDNMMMIVRSDDGTTVRPIHIEHNPLET
jgi:hypothetical protein